MGDKCLFFGHPDWATRPAVIIASGPSLSGEQIEIVREARSADRCRVVAVNNTAGCAPWADVVYFGDHLALREYLPKLQKVTSGEWWTASKAAADRWKLRYVRSAGKAGLGTQMVHLNGNSGFQALNLATLFGARKVLLLGFDMRLGPGGRKHWFGSHPAPLVQELLFSEWLKKAAPIAADAKTRGIEVLNCTPGSALECFDRGDLRAALDGTFNPLTLPVTVL